MNLLKPLRVLYLTWLGSDKNWIELKYSRFLGGAVLGAFLVVLPLLYSGIDSWAQLMPLQLSLCMFVVVACGILTTKLGGRFYDAVMKGFGTSGF